MGFRLEMGMLISYPHQNKSKKKSSMPTPMLNLLGQVTLIKLPSQRKKKKKVTIRRLMMLNLISLRILIKLLNLSENK